MPDITWKKENGKLMATLEGNVIGYVQTQSPFGWWESPFDAVSLLVHNPQRNCMVDTFKKLKDAKQWITHRTTKDGMTLKPFPVVRVE